MQGRCAVQLQTQPQSSGTWHTANHLAEVSSLLSFCRLRNLLLPPFPVILDLLLGAGVVHDLGSVIGIGEEVAPRSPSSLAGAVV
jgi:hypothetical protein